MRRKVKDKVQALLKHRYDYGSLGKDQRWYLEDGSFLEGEEAYCYLYEQVNIMKRLVKKAEELRLSIEALFTELHLTNNLCSNVMELGECVSMIELYAQAYIDEYRELLDTSVNDTSDEELPF